MTVLRDLLDASLDGEWGKGEPGPNTVEMFAIRGTDFDDVRVGSIEGVPVRFLEERHARRKRLQAYDIVFETAGGTKDQPTGRSLLLTPHRLSRFSRPVTCASFARFLRIDPNKADPVYVFWLLQHLYNSRELLRFHTQHTGVARFQFTIFADTHHLSLPRPEVQERVAGILSAYDDLIAVNTRRIAILEAMARRLFDEWSTEHVSSNWKVGTLGDLAEIIGASTAPGGTPDHLYAHFSLPSFDDTQLPVVEAGRAIMSNKLQFQWPAVLLSKLNPRIPRVWYVGAEPPATAICSTEFVPLRPKAPIGIGWLTSLCLSAPFMGALRGLAQGTSTSHQRAKPGDILALPARLPPRDFALRAERVLANNFDLCHVLRLANNNLRAARDILLPKLISGDIGLEQAGRSAERTIRRVAAA